MELFSAPISFLCPQKSIMFVCKYRAFLRLDLMYGSSLSPLTRSYAFSKSFEEFSVWQSVVRVRVRLDDEYSQEAGKTAHLPLNKTELCKRTKERTSLKASGSLWMLRSRYCEIAESNGIGELTFKHAPWLNNALSKLKAPKTLFISWPNIQNYGKRARPLSSADHILRDTQCYSALTERERQLSKTFKHATPQYRSCSRRGRERVRHGSKEGMSDRSPPKTEVAFFSLSDSSALLTYKTERERISLHR